MLSEVFQIHPLALQDCRERHHFAKAYAYPDHLFVILQTPEPETTQFFHLAGVLGGIGAITLLMSIWAKRQGWW